MTGRSMSDEQMQERYGWDKEPWVNARGERFATFNDGADASDPFDKSGALKLDPRPSCIPSPDPTAMLTNIRAVSGRLWSVRHARNVTCGEMGCLYRPRRWGEFTPDPEFVRSEVQPILSSFREAWEHGPIGLPGDGLPRSGDTLSGYAANWLIRDSHREWLRYATPEQVAFARLVLTRLRDVTEAGL